MALSSITPIRPLSGCAIGVDVGGTKIAAGVVTFPDATVHARDTVPTDPQRGGEAVLADVERLVERLQHEAEAAGLSPTALGVGLCEIVDRSGTIASANAIAWENLPVRERLSRLLPTVLEADVRAAARAEAWFGAGRGCGAFLYVTVGTGIASCLVIDGEPFVGARGAAGTMASGPLPNFSGDFEAVQPSLEALASGPALVARFNALGGAAQSGRDVLVAAHAHNNAAVEVVCSAGEALGAVIGSLVNVLDPERVVIGGGLGLSEGLYRDALINAMRRHIWWPGHRDVRMVSAATGTDAGVLGAAALAARLPTSS
jgi:glucokinase